MIENYTEIQCHRLLTEHNVGDGESKDKYAVNGERDEKQVEISVVSATDTVADPWTMVVKPL